jgi:hypothetical protein
MLLRALGVERRRWRAPDFGLLRMYVVAPTPRVRCAEHGVVVANSAASVRHFRGEFDPRICQESPKTH